MKRFLMLIAILQVCLMAKSQLINEQYARKIAQNFFDRVAHESVKVRNRSLTGKSIDESIGIKNISLKKFKGKPSYFINNIEGGGWVLISADKKTGPVIAYSENGVYDTLNLPPVMNDWMAQYDELIEVRSKLSIDMEEKNKTWKDLEKNTSMLKQAYQPDEYLVKSFWEQSYPYNRQVTHSTADCGICPAGCVCIAMCQIINYWGYATGNKADYEFWNMPNVLYSSSPQAELDATSYMIKIVGDDKLESDYCDGGCQTSHPVTTNIFSSTPGVGDVFDDLGYYPYSMEYHDCTWYTYNGWLDLIKSEIDAKRPVYYRYVGKHSFICDGYSSAGHMLHFNIGWGPFYMDLWSDYEDLNVNGNDFTDMGNHACITGIHPDISTDNTLNTTLNSGDNKTWQVSNNLVANSFIINSGSKCQLVGGNSVNLKPGFWAKPGSRLTAKAFVKGSIFGNYKSATAENYVTSSADIQKNPGKLLNPVVFPNPVVNVLTFDGTIEGNGKYSVYDFNGKEILTGFVTSQHTQIDFQNLSKGLYMLRVFFIDRYYLFKVVKR